MPKVERVVVRVETPDEARESRSLEEAVRWARNLLVEHGHRDGYGVRLSVEVAGRELDEDTGWLERALGRQAEREHSGDRKSVV